MCYTNLSSGFRNLVKKGNFVQIPAPTQLLKNKTNKEVYNNYMCFFEAKSANFFAVNFKMQLTPCES